MGTNFDCGCRTSGGHWFPCKYHERDLRLLIERRQFIQLVKNYRWECCDKATLKDIPIEDLDLDYEED